MKVEKILAAADTAPTAGNFQGFENYFRIFDRDRVTVSFEKFHVVMISHHDPNSNKVYLTNFQQNTPCHIFNHCHNSMPNLGGYYFYRFSIAKSAIVFRIGVIEIK